jgi:hypothetical protein
LRAAAAAHITIKLEKMVDRAAAADTGRLGELAQQIKVLLGELRQVRQIMLQVAAADREVLVQVPEMLEVVTAEVEFQFQYLEVPLPMQAAADREQTVQLREMAQRVVEMAEIILREQMPQLILDRAVVVADQTVEIREVVVQVL